MADESITLTDEDIVTTRVGGAQPLPTADRGDDSGDVSDTSDTGDDSGDTGDTGDTGDDSGDTSDTSDTGDDAG